MKRVYDHTNHCYRYETASNMLVNALANTKGVHDNPIAEKHIGGLFPMILIFGVGLAILCGGGFHTVEEKRCDWWVCL